MPLRQVQRGIREAYRQDVPLPLATLWQPFAEAGLAEVALCE